MEFINLERNILYCIGNEWIQSKKLKAFKKKLLFEEFSDIPAKNIEDAIGALKNDEFLEMTPDNDRLVLTQKGLSQIEILFSKPFGDKIDCSFCGIPNTNTGHMCKNKLATMKYVCEGCGRIAMEEGNLCKPSAIS